MLATPRRHSCNARALRCRRLATRSHVVARAEGFCNNLNGSTVAIIGLGVSGVSAAKVAAALGAVVRGFDSSHAATPLSQNAALPEHLQNRCFTSLGPLDPQALRHIDLVVVSPGVPVSTLQSVIDRQVPVISELAFAARYLPRSTHTTAITGTNGKSTTTEFTAQLLESAGLSVWKGGNLGVPLSELAWLHLHGHTYQHAVVEVSSYQLEAPGSFEPDVACVLNLTPDHLERHGSMQVYAHTKLQLLQRTRPGGVMLTSPDCLPFAASVDGGAPARGSATIGSLPGCMLQGADAVLQLPSWHAARRLDLSALGPRGAHNRLNAACAAFLALAAAPSALSVEQVQAALPGLAAPPHRMQLVAEQGGLRWYDDSKATNVAATQAAVGCLDEPSVVLLGGQGKPLPSGALGFESLARDLARHRGVVTFGADGGRIAAELAAGGVRVHRCCASLSEATHVAALVASDAGAAQVVLSPGCASFDEFRNFADRGDKFRQYVEAVQHERTMR